jgi:hypothetical protein
MTTTQNPSDQSLIAVLVTQTEFLAAARAGAILPPAEDVFPETEDEPDYFGEIEPDFDPDFGYTQADLDAMADAQADREWDALDF